MVIIEIQSKNGQSRLRLVKTLTDELMRKNAEARNLFTKH